MTVPVGAVVVLLSFPPLLHNYTFHYRISAQLLGDPDHCLSLTLEQQKETCMALVLI